MLAENFDKINEIAKIHCNEWGIPHYLHQDDYILQYGIDHLGIDRAVHSYFHAARHEANMITKTIDNIFTNKNTIKVLDFASGYGRIARHVKYFDKRIELHAADIHVDAVSFMQNRLGLSAYLSSFNPESADMGCEYDFIYVLSLFSHLPEDLFISWLCELYKRVKQGGYILFTTHGIKSLLSNPNFFNEFYDQKKGYGFKGISEQHDLDGGTYGTTIVSPSFVVQKLESIDPGAVLVQYTAGKWFGNIFQDEYLIQKS